MPAWISTALAWLLGLGACAPLLWGGLASGHDWPLELVRTAAFRQALEEGQLPPYWGSALYGGYGSPVFLYYAPLFSLLGSLAWWLVGDASQALVVALVAATAIGVWTTRCLVDASLPPGIDAPLRAAARSGGVGLYLLSPYLLGNALVRNADAEYLALCLLPLPLAGLLWLERRPWRGSLWIAVGLATVTLAHNLSALVAGAALAFCAPALYGRRLLGRAGLALAVGLATAALLSAFLWLPAVWLRSGVSTDLLLSEHLDFRHYFVPVGEWLLYRHFFSLGALAPGVLLVALVVAWLAPGPLTPRTRRVLSLALGGAALALGLQLSASAPVWERVPLLPFFQFPWRMMGPLSLAVAWAGSLLLVRIGAGLAPGRLLLLEALVAGACLANAAPALLRYEALPAEAEQRVESQLTREALRESRLSGVFDEYLGAADPGIWRARRPVLGPVVASQPRAEISLERDAPERSELWIESPGGTRLELARWRHPVFRLEVDGRAEPPLATRSGALAVQVPPGRHRLTLRRTQPPVRSVGLALGGLGVLAVLLLAWKGRGSLERGESRDYDPLPHAP